MTTKPVKDQTLEFKLKTCVLKVSIDCEGCKKRVQKILGGVEGVYATVVDAEHNKVTVTGNVDADKLIRRLAKSGKHAEFITPEKKENIKKQSNNSKQSKNAKQSNTKDHGSERKADTATENRDGDVGKQRKSKKTEKQSEATTAVGSPVSTLPPLDPTSLPVNYGMSYGMEPYMFMDHIRNVDEHEDEQSGCFIM